VGLWDDFPGLSTWQKLVGQVGAAVYASWLGLRLATPLGYTGPTFPIYLAGVCWLVLCANAFNLIDGLDGLATGVAFIASASLLLAALIHHETGLALVIAPLVGTLLGFLYFNSNPASVYLGDSGSLVMGFLLGCYGLMWNQHAKNGLNMTAPLVLLAFPVAEVGLSVFRRFIRGQPIFAADRGHIHHRILSFGVSPRAAVLILYGVAALAAAVAILQTILRPQFATMLLVLFLAAACFGLRALHYSEFGMLSKYLFAGGFPVRRLFTGEFRVTLQTNFQLHEFEQFLATAQTIEQCWLVLKETCAQARFSYISLWVNGLYFDSAVRLKVE
jgi:UDP-GlcNAc:undecaprenyl-phosphate GlcNAc-1-phosphate transferase